MTRIDMWPVLDHGGFKLDGGRLRKRVGGMRYLVADGLYRNVHLKGFLAKRGDGTMLGRLSQGEVAAALGFGLAGWEANVLHGVRLTEDEWRAAHDTPDIRDGLPGLTCNQVVVLLDVHRGTFCEDRHMGTVAGDMSRLIRGGLVTADPVRCTQVGSDMVVRILTTLGGS